MAKPRRTVLIIDDNAEDQTTFRRFLDRSGDFAYTCFTAETASDGLRLCRELHPDVVLLDYKLPDEDGLSLLVKLSGEPGQHAIVMLTAFGNEAIAVRAMMLGAQNYLVKDTQIEQNLSLAIENAIDKARLQRENKQQRRELEISNRRLQQVLAAQQASLAQLDLALQATNMATWEWNLATGQVRWGEGLESMLSMTSGSFDGTYTAFLELIHPNDRANVSRALDRALHEGVPYDVQFRMVRSDGSIRWTATRGHVVRGERGVPLRMLGIDMDITNQKQAETTLQASQQRLSTIWQAASDAMVLSDAEGIVLDANPAYCELYGYTRDEMVGHSFAIIFPPSQREWAIDQYREIIRTRALLPAYTASIQRSDGEARFVESRATVLTLGDGEIGMLSIIRDISDRAAAEDARARLLEQERQARETAEMAASYTTRLQHVTASLSGAVTPDQVAEIALSQGLEAIGAQAGTIVFLTADATNLEVFHSVGYPPEKVQQWQRFPLSAHTPMSDAVRTGQLVVIESRTAAIARYPRLAEMKDAVGEGALLAFPLNIGDQTLGGFGVSFWEPQTFSAHMLLFLTSLVQQCAQAFERAKIYKAAEDARSQAEEAVYEREAFLSIASHEIKNPLTSLLGRAQLLQRRLDRLIDNERMRDDIGIIISQGQRINTLLSDLLDLSHVNHGQLATADHAPVDLSELATRLAAALQMTTSAHVLTVNSDGPLVVAGDASRLEQVFHNLLSNALKYSPAGGTIRIDLAQEREYARLSISDTGLGIPADALPHLFKRFYRVTRTDEQAIAGSGIGLYVVKQVIASHGGKIEVTSTENVGTTFTILLPRQI